LKQAGATTIAQLAESLQLTGEAIRQQLLQLQREGWVELAPGRASRTGTGRPATTYRLTEAGDHLFPKHYGVLSVLMIDALAEELGIDALLRVLARLTDERVAAMEPLVRDLPLLERLVALKSWYLEDDPYMTAEQRDGEIRLVERNCPFLHTALSRPALCSVSVNALTRLLGVRVRREQTFQNGDGRCVFRVRAEEPIDPSTWTFRLEQADHTAPDLKSV
jgi:predicted ArsR family transcriptional regulator